VSVVVDLQSKKGEEEARVLLGIAELRRYFDRTWEIGKAGRETIVKVLRSNNTEDESDSTMSVSDEEDSKDTPSGSRSPEEMSEDRAKSAQMKEWVGRIMKEMAAMKGSLEGWRAKVSALNRAGSER